MDKGTMRQEIDRKEAQELAVRIQEQLAEKVKEIKNAKETYPTPLKFWALKGLGKPEVLKILGKPLRNWIPLHAMVDMLSSGSKCIFWRTVFEHHDCIPRDELLKVWYTFFDSYYDDERYANVDPRAKREEYCVLWSRPHQLAVSAVTHPMLIDNPVVCEYYVKACKPGYQFLRCITGRHLQALNLSDELEQALNEDDTPSFEMYRLMQRQNICYSLLAEILMAKATSILRHLVENDAIPKSAVSLPELCCTCAARFRDSYSVPLLTAIEEARPGTIKSVHDNFGRNLLWYALHNQTTGWFHPNCKLTQFLLEKGCDPDNQNQAGLTWREVTDGLTLTQKKRIMTSRYNNWRRNSHTEELRRTQPLEALEI